jgi:hypothetical protein
MQQLQPDDKAFIKSFFDVGFLYKNDVSVGVGGT